MSDLYDFDEPKIEIFAARPFTKLLEVTVSRYKGVPNIDKKRTDS